MNLDWKFSLFRFTLGGTLILAPFSLVAADEEKRGEGPPDGYTINYNTVSMAEYVRFASKICNQNFLFNEADLAFTVSVVSDAPITAQNVMATLLQLLRIHGLMLLEQGNNLVIHRSTTIRQPATIVLEDGKNTTNAPVVTRIFRLKNANPSSVSAIIRPMISDEALLEISIDTRQLILTDVTGSVDKVAMLIENLDAPHTPLEIRSFEAKFNSPDYLINLASQIMNPIAQGNPFILVPQPLANTLFIVSTPEMNEKAVAVLVNLDVPPKRSVIAERKIRSENIFILKLDHRSGEEVLRSLKDLAEKLQTNGMVESDLLETIDTAKWIPDTNTLLFVGSAESNAKIKEFVSALDVPGQGEGVKTSFFVYKPTNVAADELGRSLNDLGDSLSKSNADEAVLATIHNMKVNMSTNTLLFSGDATTFAKIKEMLTSLDTPGPKPKAVAKANFYVYKIRSPDPDRIQASIQSFAKNLEKSNVDPTIVQTIESMRYIKESHSLLFTGPDDAIRRIQDLLTQFDVGGEAPIPTSSQFLIYKPKNQKGDRLLESVKEIDGDLKSSELADPALLRALESAKWVKSTNSILFTGDPASLQKITDLISHFDQPGKSENKSFFLYKPEYATAAKTESYLKSLADQLDKKQNADLIQAIYSMKWLEPSQSYVFNGTQKSLDRIKEALVQFDTPTAAPPAAPAAVPSAFFIYPLKYAPEDKTDSYLDAVADRLNKKSDAALIEAIRSKKWIAESNSFIFTGTQANLDRIKDILTTYDVPAAAEVSTGFALIPLKNAAEGQIQTYLNHIADQLNSKSDKDLIEAIHSIKWIEDSRSFMVNGTNASVERIRQMIDSADIAPQATPQASFALYPLQYVPSEKTQAYLNQVADRLNKKTDRDLIDAIHSMKWIEESHSLMFNGTQASLDRIKSILSTYDVQANARQEAPAPGFFLYQLKYASQPKTEAYLKQIADQVNKKADPDLVEAIRSMKWIESSHSYMFNGTQASLDRIRELLTAFDTPTASRAPTPGFVMVPLRYATQSQAAQYFDQVADNLSKKGGDPALIEALRSKKWIEDSHSFMFSGSEDSLNQIKELMAGFDTESKMKKGPAKMGYFIYKLQNAPAEDVEEDLETLLKSMKGSGLGDADLVYVLEHIRVVKETNSLLLTGDPKALEEAKDVIAKYDTTRQAAPRTGNFFMYKPQHSSAQSIEKSLRDIGANLKKADLADPNLLAAIDSMKYVETTNSLIFTGTPDAIQKIQMLLKDIDTEQKEHAPIQHIGKTTFLLYKLKMASGPQIVSSLKTITADLKKSNTTDKDFLAALNSMKYVRETNSLMFTGTEEALGKVQALVEKFDVSSLAAPSPAPAKPEGPPGPSEFFVYRPIALPGPELEKTLNDFADNLRMSGLNDPGLFGAVQSMKYVEKTQTLVFSGDQKSLDRIKELLKEFDIPGPKTDSAPSETSIQSIDNTSFLVYKLQFHKGDEIQNALRQIAKDLLNTNAPVNQTLLTSINSIQWLEVTNSLLCSGDQETLTRLRELIKSLDIPLKQVFIEILVIETSLTNTLNFGLDWAGKLKYKNKFSSSFNNLNPADTSSQSGQTTTGQQFTNNLSTVTATTPPTPQMIPFSTGFELGVIGDIIMHNGQSYLSLGSLVNALQTDVESSIVMTPKIIAQDSRTATIFSGQNVPFAGSFISNTTSSTLTTSNIEYRDVGMNLSITPVLGNSDVITLDISLDNSSQVTSSTGAQFNFTGGQATGITTSRTTMTTTVHVPNKHFLVLSGYVNNSSVKTKAGIPCLGGLPVIGAAFSENDDIESTSNVVIFMRPTILDSIDDMTKLTSDQEDYFRYQAGTPNLEHRYDEAMELIKTPDDD